MKFLLCALLAVNGADAPRFRPMSQNSAPCALCDDCACVVCLCPAVAKPAPAKVAPTVKQSLQVAPAKPATRTVIVHQNSREHTHSCPNAKCSFRARFGEPYTWNHAMDGGNHACAYCKTKQMVVSNRPVTVVREVSDTAVPQAKAPARAVAPTSPVTFSGASSGCSNGQCATFTRGRR